jgi:hypothetical protein
MISPRYALGLATLMACGSSRTTQARFPGGAIAFDRAASDPKALAIADKVVAAAGGAERWNKVKQLRWSESVKNDGKEIIGGEQAWDRWEGRHYGRLKRAGGDMVVMRPIYAAGGSAFIDTGKSLNKIADGTDEAIAAARERWQFDTAALCMQFLLEEPGAKLEYGGEVEGEPGKPADDLKLTIDPKDTTRTATYHVVIDRDTNLINRIEIVKAGDADTHRLGYRLEGWTEAGGLKFPTVVDNIGQPAEVIGFKDITIAEPDETLYVPPISH